MAAYISGLYLLDPFYISATSGRRRGVLRMDEIAPEAFTESGYYGMFYKNVNVGAQALKSALLAEGPRKSMEVHSSVAASIRYLGSNSALTSVNRVEGRWVRPI